MADTRFYLIGTKEEVERYQRYHNLADKIFLDTEGYFDKFEESLENDSDEIREMIGDLRNEVLNTIGFSECWYDIQPIKDLSYEKILERVAQGDKILDDNLDIIDLREYLNRRYTEEKDNDSTL